MTATVLITDTHPLIWYMTGQMRRLPKKVAKVFDSATEGRIAIFIPLVVLWEVSMTVKAGKVRLPLPLDEYVQTKFFANSISILPIEVDDIMHSHRLRFTNDPFDTMIVAMAKRIEAPLITGDAVIHKHKPCELFWD